MATSQEPQVVPPEVVDSSATPPNGEIPPTNQPPVPSTDPNGAISELVRATLRDQNARLQALADENERLRNARQEPTPQPLSTEESRAAFYNDPVAMLDTKFKKLEEDLLKTVRPLLDFTTKQQQVSTLDGLKNQLKSDPRFAPHLADPNIDRFVDSVMRSGRVEINEQNLANTIIQGVGMKATGVLEGSASTPQPERSSVTPPYTPPTPPRLPTTPPPADKRVAELTENERLMAKIQGKTLEEYVMWRDAASTEITGRAKK